MTYPYDVLKDVLVKENDFLFPTNFVILDTKEDAKIPLVLGRRILETSIDLIDVELCEHILRFQDEKMIFNIFEEMCHHNENP